MQSKRKTVKGKISSPRCDENTALLRSPLKIPNYDALLPPDKNKLSSAVVRQPQRHLRTQSASWPRDGHRAYLLPPSYDVKPSLRSRTYSPRRVDLICPSFQEETKVAVIENAGEKLTPIDVLILVLPVAIPGAVIVFATFGLSAVLFAFSGHYLGSNEMASISIAYYVLSVFGIYPGVGLCFAVDTLVSQAHGRDPESDVQGEIAQRSILVSTIFLIPVSLFLWNVEPILSHYYEPHVARNASRWLVWGPLFLMPIYYYTAFAKFLCNQYCAWPPAISLAIALLVMPLTQRICVEIWRFEGSAIGFVLSGWVQLIVVMILLFRDPKAARRFGPWDFRRAANWKGLKEYLRIGLPSLVFVLSESSAFDLTVLICGTVSTMAVAAWTPVLSICLLLVATQSGLSVAATAAVGNALGHGDGEGAKLIAKTCAATALLIGLFDSLMLIAFHQTWLKIFTSDPKVLHLADKIIWLTPILHTCDGIQFTFQGIYSGAGQNHRGAVILLCTLWFIGVVGGYYMSHVLDLGLTGVAGGLTLGLFVECPILILICFLWFDWDLLAKEASESGNGL